VARTSDEEKGSKQSLKNRWEKGTKAKTSWSNGREHQEKQLRGQTGTQSLEKDEKNGQAVQVAAKHRFFLELPRKLASALNDLIVNLLGGLEMRSRFQDNYQKRGKGSCSSKGTRKFRP